MDATPMTRITGSSPEERARCFLEQAKHFKLGHLPTESRHPRTTKLSQLASHNLGEAVQLLKDVELDAMSCLIVKLPEIEAMAEEIRATLNSGGRIFLSGCGATGRLSLSLETLWREEAAARGMSELADKVVAFMAGGDYAMVRSIENFEDHPEYGARQLRDLGFSANDLLIGCTEGGETPFVIGSVEEAAQISTRRPYFLFCNPAEMLAETVERSRRVIESDAIVSIALETGPMAVSGSTRLQATTALMLATGAAMFSALERPARPRAFIDEFLTGLRSADFSGLVPLIAAEAEVYNEGSYCLHRTSRYGITVLTDTTERSPTFSLLPFENTLEAKPALSWTYLIHRDARHALDAWEKILGRAPRPLSWDGFKERFGHDSLKGFDFSPLSAERRTRMAGDERMNIFDIDSGARDITLHLNGIEARLPRSASRLCEHLILKCALNISSTLAMGRLGRFSGNLMLYVRAANNKLVDRAVRYIQILLSDESIHEFGYDEICLELFKTAAEIRPDEPAVWKTFERLRTGSTSAAL